MSDDMQLLLKKALKLGDKMYWSLWNNDRSDLEAITAERNEIKELIKNIK